MRSRLSVYLATTTTTKLLLQNNNNKHTAKQPSEVSIPRISVYGRFSFVFSLSHAHSNVEMMGTPMAGLRTPPLPVFIYPIRVADVRDVPDVEDTDLIGRRICPSDMGEKTLDEFAGGVTSFKSDGQIIEDDDVFNSDGDVPEAMPEREEELDAIHRALSPVVRGASPKNRLIFGKPGQGKTAAVKLKRQQLEQVSAQDDLNVRFIYISCKENPSSYDVTQAIVQDLKDSTTKPKGYQLSELYDVVYNEMNAEGGTYIIILDEVDAIRTHKSKYDEPNEPNILYKLPRSRSSESLDDAKLGIIGISNDRKFRKNLTPRCMDAFGDATINFKPYSEEQLVNILIRRAERGLKETNVTVEQTPGGYEYTLDSSVVSREQLRRCAELAAQERGSARQALRYLGRAAGFAENESADAISDDHIRQAEKQVRQEFVHETLTDHTEEDWLAFCGILWCEARGRVPAKTGDIHNEYSTVCNVLDKRAKVQRRMRERLKDLDLTGVIDLQKESGGQPGGEYFTAELTLPFGETLKVMENEEPFAEQFSEIVAEIREAAERNGEL